MTFDYKIENNGQIVKEFNNTDIAFQTIHPLTENAIQYTDDTSMTILEKSLNTFFTFLYNVPIDGDIEEINYNFLLLDSIYEILLDISSNDNFNLQIFVKPSSANKQNYIQILSTNTIYKLFINTENQVIDLHRGVQFLCVT